MTLEDLFAKTYNSETYNCAHFACDVYSVMGLGDLTVELEGLLCGHKARRLPTEKLRSLKPIQTPCKPCLAIFQARKGESHVGVFVDGKILHLGESGPKWSFLDDVMLSFNRVRFYNV